MGRVASVVLALSGGAALAALVFSLTQLGSPLSGLQIVLFYILPAAWVLANLIALRSGMEARVGFALLQLSLGVAVVIGEVGATLWLNSRAAQTPPSTMREEVLRLRAEGVDAFPRIVGNEIVDSAPSFVIGDTAFRPLSTAPSHSTVLLCDEDRPMLSYVSDRFGFDNPDSVWNTAQADMALVGDSYTVGVCVPSDQAIPGRLRAHGTVLNLGVSGTGPLQELALLREYAAPLRPRQVVWVFYEGNDFWDLKREAKREWLTAYLDGDHVQGLRQRQQMLNQSYRAWVDSMVEAVPARPAPRRATRALKVRSVALLTSLRTLLPIEVQPPWRASELGPLPAILARAQADVQSWGGGFLVVYLPSFRRFRTLLGDPFPDRDALLDTLRALDIQTLDLREIFDATPNPRALWVTPRSHLTPDGYGLAAAAIERALGLRGAAGAGNGEPSGGTGAPARDTLRPPPKP